jgi:hypothetical protein
VGAEEHRIDAATVPGEQVVHAGMHLVEHGHVEQAAAQPRLVGGKHRMPAGVVEPRDRLQRTGQRHPFLRRLDVVVAVLVDGAVPVKDDELHDATTFSTQPRR